MFIKSQLHFSAPNLAKKAKRIPQIIRNEDFCYYKTKSLLVKFRNVIDESCFNFDSNLR